MYLVRDVMHCKPGRVKEMVTKFKHLSALMKQKGQSGLTRVLTDAVAERYWTVVIEQEAESLGAWEQNVQQTMGDPEFQKVMKDYHDIVESGRREIFKIE